VAFQQYPKAPITEALIEVQFGVAQGIGTLQKASKQLGEFYPSEEMLQNIEFRVDAANPKNSEARVDENARSYRRMSANVSELVLLMPSSFVVSQLAPYPGWQIFLERFSRDWQIWKRIVGYVKISRVGVRYINRLDIPSGKGSIRPADYLNVYVKTPELFGEHRAYGCQAEMVLDSSNFKLILNSGGVPSPLAAHTSLLLDIDIIKDDDPPQKDDELIAVLSSIRESKNMVFENLVTDAARELFSRE
jgi:uncharacterized protein (TIGR04255 family)